MDSLLLSSVALLADIVAIVTVIWAVFFKGKAFLEQLDKKIDALPRAVASVSEVSPLLIFGIKDTKFLTRLLERRSEKTAIAAKIADIIEDHEIIVLDSGTTTDQVPSQLAAKHKIHVTVISNNLLAAMGALGREISVNLVPGHIDDEYAGIFGEQAVNAARELSCNATVIAATSMTAEKGPCASSHPNRLFKLALIGKENSGRLIFAVDGTKLRSPRGGEVPVFDERAAALMTYHSWDELISKKEGQLFLVTSPPDEKNALQQGVTKQDYESQISHFEAKGFQVLRRTPTED